MPAFVSIAFEILKGLFGIVTEAWGASAKQLEELSDRFIALLRVGADELAAAREDARNNVERSDEREAAALARIRAAHAATVSPPAVIIPDPPKT